MLENKGETEPPWMREEAARIDQTEPLKTKEISVQTEPLQVTEEAVQTETLEIIESFSSDRHLGG